MRNIRNIQHSKFGFAGGHLTATAWDPTDDSLILAFGPSVNNPVITLKRLPENGIDAADSVLITSWDAPSPNPDLAVDRILDLHCFPDTKSLGLVLAGGDIVIVREDAQPGEGLIEIVGSVDVGITAAAWSPDEELLAVATGAGTFLFMTGEYDSIANITLSPDDLKVSNHVSVGWGKKETQFKGRGVAKTLRDPTVPEHVDEGTLSAFDDERATVSWRGDGQYVAINSILDAEQKRRVIRVYSREGVLESVSEPVNGLEGALSWKPSGQIIAGIQRQDKQIDVVFFERNGLRHGEFSLRLEEDEMASTGRSIDLKWNTDSTVLAVSMTDRVQLWTMGNYYYYLKQEIRVRSDLEHAMARMVWHPEKPLNFCCTNDSNLHRLSYRFEVCRGPVIPPYDTGMVAVIDGKRLKITPLRIANVPPPMAFDEIELPENALDVTIASDGRELAVLLVDTTTSLWECDYASKPVKHAVLKQTSRNSNAGKRFEGSTDEPLINGEPKPDVCKPPHLRTDHDRILYDNVDDGTQELYGPSVALSQPSKVVWRNNDGTKISFSTNDNGVLQIVSKSQDHCISGCTSFIVTHMHLIFTTSQHLLKFVHLHGGDLQIPPDEPEKDERCRSIERGAKIITVVPSAYSLMLQMPRGNLETIYPRALVLAGIRESIGKRDYKTAFSICRTQRVDMNILHDYMPEQFMRDVELFLQQIKKKEHVDLFLSSLAEDNVSETMYRDTLAPAEEPVINGVSHGKDAHTTTLQTSKINKICDAFLRMLQKQSPIPLQNIVTAYVSKNPPDLEAGLRLVSDLRAQEDQGNLEEAVEHVCFLADVNQLFDTALGLYDLDVALLVAQQSQKDPREYLPYLQSLHDMQPLRQRFAIDNDLKRHNNALTHLHALESFDELKDYTIKHELYSKAIELYRYDTTKLTELMRLHAYHMSSRNRFKEAGIAYEYISDHLSAYEAYRSVSMWQECLSNAILVPLPEKELLSIAEDLASSLEESKDFQSAAVVRLEHLNDVEGAARLLCKGHHFAEAIRLVTVRQRPELLKAVVDSGLVETSATTTEILAEMKSQLAAQIPRLRELRQKKSDDPIAFLDGMDGGDADIPDNLSLAPTDASTTGGTFMTRYTNRSTGTFATNATRKTSKNRRREERKRARGKKGTVYEEEYLVNSIARLIERLNEVSADSARLVEGLMRRTMRERAVAVQAAVDEVHDACRDCMEEVFRPRSDGDVAEHDGLANGDTPTRPWGGQGVLWDALTTSKREAPALKSFERLSLLA